MSGDFVSKPVDKLKVGSATVVQLPLRRLVNVSMVISILNLMALVSVVSYLFVSTDAMSASVHEQIQTRRLVVQSNSGRTIAAIGSLEDGSVEFR